MLRLCVVLKFMICTVDLFQQSCVVLMYCSISSVMRHYQISPSDCQFWPPCDWRIPRGHPCTTWMEVLMLMYSQLTPVSTQAWRKASSHVSGDMPSTRQRRIVGSAAEDNLCGGRVRVCVEGKTRGSVYSVGLVYAFADRVIPRDVSLVTPLKCWHCC